MEQMLTCSGGTPMRLISRHYQSRAEKVSRFFSMLGICPWCAAKMVPDCPNQNAFYFPDILTKQKSLVPPSATKLNANVGHLNRLRTMYLSFCRGLNRMLTIIKVSLHRQNLNIDISSFYPKVHCNIFFKPCMMCICNIIHIMKLSRLML